jgi:hypothetical protein
MKQSDVKIGETYLTRINGGLSRVVVISMKVEHNPCGGDKKRTLYTVSRPDAPQRTMTRTAAALRSLTK